MSRKRSRVIKLCLLGVASLLVGGCGGCNDTNDDLPLPPKVDPTLAKTAIASGTGVVVADAFSQAATRMASGPGTGGITPGDLTRLTPIIDQA
ncbi:MAG TPA: hypothetical protein PKD72_05320, partial [Gemmatales bacterium]|nr:hypothetical protein [Gemmatales bacterium]